MIDKIPLPFYNKAMKISDGFIGERLTVIPEEILSKHRKNIFVKRLYLTDVGYFPNAKGHYRERPDGIAEYIFFYCISGKGTVCIDGTEFTLTKDTAICIPRFAKHRYASSEDDPWTILWVHFNGEDTKLYPLDNAYKIVFKSKFSSNRMMFLFNQLFWVIDSSYTLGNFIYMAQTLQMILSETYYKDEVNFDQVPPNKYLNAIVKYFYRNLSKCLTLQDLCDDFKISKSYINALFQKYTACSPLNYFTDLKMKEACKMLRSTDNTIKSIAVDLGYLDPYYFSFLFKKHIGSSPKEYRTSNTIF